MICGMPTSISESRRFVDDVTSGNARQALDAVVGRLAVALDQAERPREVALLAKTLLAVIQAIEKLPKPKSGRSLEDELDQRREERERRHGGRIKEEHPRNRWKPGEPSRET